MPKVTFVREHRTVEAQAGERLGDVARRHGIAMCREAFAGTKRGNDTCWVSGAAGAVSAPGLLERLLGQASGRRRRASQVRVLGDVEVWTQSGLDLRVGAARPVAPPPRPTDDPDAPRLPIDASGSAAFPYGDPRAVGRGAREARPRSTAKPTKNKTSPSGEEDES